MRRSVYLARHYREQGVDLLYTNLPQLLPNPPPTPRPPELMPKTDVIKASDISKMPTSLDKLYDSEKSDDDNDNDGTEDRKFVSLNVKQTAEDPVAPPSQGCRGIAMCDHARELMQRSLSCMAELHDNLSFLDSCFCVSDGGVTPSDDTRWPQTRCRMLPGLSDDASDTDTEVTQSWWRDSCVEDMRAMLETYSFKRTKETLTGILEEVDSLEDLDRHLVSESLRVPVSKQHRNPWTCRETDEEVK